MIKKIQQEIDQLQERLEGMTHNSMRAKLEGRIEGLCMALAIIRGRV